MSPTFRRLSLIKPAPSCQARVPDYRAFTVEFSRQEAAVRLNVRRNVALALALFATAAAIGGLAGAPARLARVASPVHLHWVTNAGLVAPSTSVDRRTTPGTAVPPSVERTSTEHTSPSATSPAFTALAASRSGSSSRRSRLIPMR